MQSQYVPDRSTCGNCTSGHSIRARQLRVSLPDAHLLYANKHPEFAGIGQRMLQEREIGVNSSLRG